MAIVCNFIIPNATPELAEWQRTSDIDTGFAFCQWQQQQECGALALTQQQRCWDQELWQPQ